MHYPGKIIRAVQSQFIREMRCMWPAADVAIKTADYFGYMTIYITTIPILDESLTRLQDNWDAS